MMNATESHGKNYMDLQAPTPPCQYISSKIINQGEQGHPVHSQAWSQIETGKKKKGGGAFPEILELCDHPTHKHLAPKLDVWYKLVLLSSVDSSISILGFWNPPFSKGRIHNGAEPI